MGSLRPNTVILNFPETDDDDDDVVGGSAARERSAKKMVECMDEADAARVAVLVCKGIRDFASAPQAIVDSKKIKSVLDVWWIVHDGGLMLYLAHILTMKGTVWAGHKIRLFTVLDPQYSSSVEAVQETLQEMLDNARINAEAQPPVLLADAGLKAFSHDWTPRSEAVDESLDAYADLKAKTGGGGGGRRNKKSKRRSIFDFVPGMGAAGDDDADHLAANLTTVGGGEAASAPKHTPKKLMKRISAVASAAVGSVIKTRKTQRRCSLHLEIGSVIALSTQRMTSSVGTDATSGTKRHQSVPSSRKGKPLFKRISAFMMGGGDAAIGAARHKSFDSGAAAKRAPLTKRISAFVMGSKPSSPVKKKSLRRTNSMMTADASVSVAVSRKELFDRMYGSRFSDEADFSKMKEETPDADAVVPFDDGADADVCDNASGDNTATATTRVVPKLNLDVPDERKKKEGGHSDVLDEDACDIMRKRSQDSSGGTRRGHSRTQTWSDLNGHIRRESAKSALVIMNMPTPMDGQRPLRYVNYLESVSKGIPRVILCHGTGREIISAD